MNAPLSRQIAASSNFSDVWNSLSHSQKIIIFKLGQAGWQLDHTLYDVSKRVAKIIHYDGKKGTVSSLGEVNFL